MKLHRRNFLELAAAAALPISSRAAWGQSYPTRAVRIVLGFSAGGSADLITRVIGQWLSERLGQQFIIDNKPGAATNLAAEAAIHAPADGYTLLFASPAASVNATLYERLNFNFIRDTAPVAALTKSPLVMVVNPSVPATSVREFIAYAKSKPATVSFASGGVGTGTHLAGELFKMMAGVDLIHVPYRGGEAPAVNDLMGGHIQLMFPAVAAAVDHIKTGELRALGTTYTTRSEMLPNVPTVAEVLPGYEAGGWAGIVAPKGTPDDIVKRLNSEINAGLADGKIRARFSDWGLTITPGSPADFAKFLGDETEKWGKVIRAANIKPI